jgi:hypothetical protein
MSESRNALSSLLRRLGVTGPACSRAFQGSDAPTRLTNRTGDGKIKLGNHLLDRLPVYRLGLAVSAALLTLSFGVATAGAALPTEFGSEGSGAGQMLEPTGVAANNDSSSLSYGDVYVLDRKNNRVDEFTGEGVFVRAWGWGVNPEEDNPVTHAREEKLQICTTATGCQGGSSGGGPGQFHEPKELGGIAVDSNGAPDSSSGDVYVLDRENERVEKFTAEGAYITQFPVGSGVFSVAAGPTGDVYVGEKEAVQEYTPAGATLGAPIKLEGAGEVSDGNGAGEISDIAVNAGGELYVTEVFELQGATLPVRRYRATGEPVGEVAECGDVPGELDCEAEGHALSLALDAAGDVFVNHFLARREVHGAKVEPRQIRAFTPAGVQLAAFATAENGVREGLAFDDQTGALYTPGGAESRVRVFVPPPPGPEVSRESAGGVEPTAAVVHATIGPDAPEFCGATHYRVEYATAKEFEATGKYGKTAPAAEGELARSFEEDPVEVPLSGLSTKTTYHYRFVASDECEEGAVEVKHTTDGADETFTTQPPALIEAEWATEVRSTSATLHATIDPFGFATEYRFVYGPSSACAGGECSVPIPDEQLGSAKTEVEQHLQGLTAGQVYHYRVITTNTIAGKQETEEGEQRSFTTQTGGEAGLPDGREWELVSPPDKHGALLEGAATASVIHAAPGGDGIEYGSNGPTEAQPAGNGAAIQVLARRTGAGWSNLDLAPPHIFPGGIAPFMAYEMFSSDLSLAVLQPNGSFEPALSKEATEQTPFLRHNDECEPTPTEAIPTTCYQPLVTRADDTTEPFIPFGEEGTERYCAVLRCGPEFLGASPDLSHIVLGQGENSRAAPLLQGVPTDSVYEWAGGKLAVVSVLPENPPKEINSPVLGNGRDGVQEHVVSNDGSRVFWSEHEINNSLAPVLFVRDMTRKETIEIGSGSVGFEGANANGTLVFGGGKECEIPLESPKLECRILDEEGTTEPLENGNVLATSEDGSWVYFREGNSIYVRHGDEAATLLASNIGNIQRPNSGEGPQGNPWRASPDGEWFAFMSDSPLTGYDNHDAVTGQPDEEVYLYSAAAKRLVCASCDPTGARPQGATELQAAVYGSTWGSQRLAASIPGWTSYSNTDAIYDPRFLSDSGRLFFNAVGGLVPRDVNGQVDVYELEPPGEGSCTTATRTGTVVYVPAAAGCVALISSGESPEESVFEDSSETGGDVFFLSSSRLSTADLDGSLSMWDAHACTVASPCIPAPASPPPACTTEASCKASPTPQPAIYGEGPSETFSGPGNVAPAPAVTKKVTKKTVKCKKNFVKDKKGKCVKKPKRKSKKAKKTNRGAKS